MHLSQTKFFSIDMPRLLTAINYISVIRYNAHIQGILEFRSLEFKCSDPLYCQFRNGDEVLNLLGFDNSESGINNTLIGMACCVLICK